MKKLFLFPVICLAATLNSSGQNASQPAIPPGTSTTQPAPDIHLDQNQNQDADQTGNPNPYFTGVFSNAVGAAGNFLSNRFGLNATNRLGGTNSSDSGSVAADDVGQMLQDLQANIEQALPILASLTGAGGTAGRQIAYPALDTTGRSPGNRPGVSPMLPGGNNQAQSGVQSSPGFVGMLGTNAVSMDQQTYQLLSVLQQNLRQTLPVLQNLNRAQALDNEQNMDDTGELTPTGFGSRLNPVINSHDTRILHPTQPHFRQQQVPQAPQNRIPHTSR